MAATNSVEAGSRAQSLDAGAWSGWSRLSAMRRREAIQGFLFITPWIIGFLAFTAYPMIASFYYSVTNYKILGSPTWIGLYNYVYAFTGTPLGRTGDPRFYLSLFRTVTWVVA